jgi:pimeloyl-ACP methyl ester carboxylesterase
MQTVMVNGLKIAYELIGAGQPIALTQGGRYSMDAPGVRELALALADGGKQVLIWDRPNCGASDMCFDGDWEPNMHADTLAGLIQTLELGKTSIIGGSAGSGVSLLTVIRHPEVVDKLAFWWIAGGYFHLARISVGYCAESWQAATHYGMEGVVALPMWDETLTKNPANRERLLAMDPEKFAAAMEAWAPRWLGYPASAEDLAKIQVPTMVFRGSPTDFYHLRRTSEWLHAQIPGSRLVEPPWDDEEWNDRMEEAGNIGYTPNSWSKVAPHLKNWPKLAPQLLEFINEPAH